MRNSLCVDSTIIIFKELDKVQPQPWTVIYFSATYHIPAQAIDSLEKRRRLAAPAARTQLPLDLSALRIRSLICHWSVPPVFLATQHPRTHMPRTRLTQRDVKLSVTFYSAGLPDTVRRSDR